MQFYTRTGDQGTTAVMGGGRVFKDDIRIQVIGAIDEVTSWVGVTQSVSSDFPAITAELTTIQHLLFAIGHDFATPDATHYPYQVTDQDVLSLEARIDAYSAQSPALTAFILPGGHPLAAHLQYARTLTRRSERLAVTFMHHAPINPPALSLLNRLADYFFVVARYVNVTCHIPEPTEPNSTGVFHPELKKDDL